MSTSSSCMYIYCLLTGVYWRSCFHCFFLTLRIQYPLSGRVVLWRLPTLPRPMVKLLQILFVFIIILHISSLGAEFESKIFNILTERLPLVANQQHTTASAEMYIVSHFLKSLLMFSLLSGIQTLIPVQLCLVLFVELKIAMIVRILINKCTLVVLLLPR